MKRRLLTTLIIFFMVFTFLGWVLNSDPIMAYAVSSGVNVSGKVYKFDKKSHYEFSSSDEYTSTADGGETYGKFLINGNITDTSEINGIASYGVESDVVKLSYTYGDSLLTADEDEWHLNYDKSKTVDDLELDERIMKGVLILQTSTDGITWVDDVCKTNAFEEIPIQTESFYSATDMQLVNGCYYRVIVAYETRIKSNPTKVLFVSLDNYEYKKQAEVYEFYVYSKNESLNVLEEPDSKLKYSLGSKVNTGKDNGYSDSNDIEKKDPHYGWELGNFFVSGYTRNTKDENGNPVFLKNVGDKVTLYFNLQQEIDNLNGNEDLSISEDSNGYDKYFETSMADFGYGALIIRYTDYENVQHEPTIYTNYLNANAKTDADTIVQLFQEGDYEVALDYKIKNHKAKVLGQSILPEYNDYRIFFKFSVRNGNCMVYPFDVTTRAELTNSSITENGFYLDLAKSRYLDINIKKEVLKEGTEGLIEDIRFNKPAKDGDQYTDEGIFTIAVSNRYTDQLTTKTIYVGTNKVLKAFVTTGLSIKEINNLVAQGSVIADDGTIISSSTEVVIPSENQDFVTEEVSSTDTSPTATSNVSISENLEASETSETSDEHMNQFQFYIVIIVVIAIIAICIAVIFYKRKRGVK
jgi:hypothetical protein